MLGSSSPYAKRPKPNATAGPSARPRAIAHGRSDALPQLAAGLSLLRCVLDLGFGVLEPSGHRCPDCLILYGRLHRQAADAASLQRITGRRIQKALQSLQGWPFVVAEGAVGDGAE